MLHSEGVKFDTVQTNTITAILFFTIIFLPVLDLLTAQTKTIYSPGALLRTCVMIGLWLYISFHFWNEKRFYFFYLQLLILLLATSFILNFFIKDPFSILEEGQFLIKTVFGIIVMFTVLFLLEKRRIQAHSILLGSIISSCIIGVSFWLAIITNSSNFSYQYGKPGYTGWFFSANEFGVILLILFALVLVAYERKIHPQAAFFSFILLLSVLPMLGTKVPLYGGLLILGVYIFWSMLALFSSKYRQWKPAFIFLALIIYGIALPFTPAAENSLHYPGPESARQLPEQLSMKQQVLSSRDVYFNETKEAFLMASPIRKLLGIGYGGGYDTSPKMVEMDGYDLLSSYGLIGFLGYVGMLFLLAVKIVRISFGKSYVILIVTCFICFNISLAAGHVLFAPAVMSYLFFLLLCTGILAKKQPI